MKLIEYMKQERYTSRHLSEAMQISIQHAYQISRAQVFASQELAEKIQAWTKNKVKADTMMRPKICRECGRPFQKEKLLGEIIKVKKVPKRPIAAGDILYSTPTQSHTN